MEKWMLKNKKYDYKTMSKKLGISEILCRLMINRGIDSYSAAKTYINPDLNRLHNPRIMKDMNKAVGIAKEKILKKSKIRIIGDYDVDGVASTYIMYSSLKKLGACIDYYLPDRVKDGYGINENIIDKAHNDNVDTIITCDNGIAAIEQIRYAKELNMTVIILDHHDIPFSKDNEGNRKFTIPEADAVVNPKQKECRYPFKSLCGAGVAFKFIQLLNEEMGIKKQETEKLLEYAAIATVCDVVDLTDENRIIVKNGLEMINNTKNIGLKSLIKYSGLQGKKINVYTLGFVIGPCINACGRLKTAEKGLKLLLADNLDEADSLAQELHNLNEERKHMTIKGVEQAEKQIEKYSMNNDKVFVIYIADIHESIAGIIAGRIKDKYNVPTIILTDAEDGIKGSGRSIEEYNMFEELTKCNKLLGKFGGHPLAAGLSMKKENVELLRNKLNSQTTLTEEELIPKVYIDVPLSINDVSIDLAEELQLLEPFGKGNSKPVFGAKNLRISRAVVLGANKNVLKIFLITHDYKNLSALYFGDIEEFKNKIIEKCGYEETEKMFSGETNDVKIDITYNISINEYMNRKTAEIVIKNYR